MVLVKCGRKRSGNSARTADQGDGILKCMWRSCSGGTSDKMPLTLEWVSVSMKLSDVDEELEMPQKVGAYDGNSDISCKETPARFLLQSNVQ